MKLEIQKLNSVANSDICIAGGIEAVLSLFQDCKCFYCGITLVASVNHEAALSWDHFLPKSKGYTFSGNLVMACRKCNSSKRSDIPSANHIRKFVKLYADAGLMCIIKIIEDDGISGRVRFIHRDAQPSQTNED